MQIIKPGNKFFGFEGEWDCGSCGCGWLMFDTDPEPQQSRDERDDGCYYMPCPNCKVRVYRVIPKSKYRTRG